MCPAGHWRRLRRARCHPAQLPWAPPPWALLVCLQCPRAQRFQCWARPIAVGLERKNARMADSQLVAPFPWFGGKRRAASEVWKALGDVDSYCEPFGGSLAVFLARPGGAGRVETVNDADGLLINWWRAVAADPAAVAAWADWPVSEADLSARHLWLVGRRESISAKLQADPVFCDVQAAGWWVWGACAWIGGGWCSGEGPWTSSGEELTKEGEGAGITRCLPHLGDAGQGINRRTVSTAEWFSQLRNRLRKVRVACGDWQRVIGQRAIEGATGARGEAAKRITAGVYLDPPYPEGWAGGVKYAGEDARGAVELWQDVKAAALDLATRGVRVVVSGYSGTWDGLPCDWTERAWHASQGYAVSNAQSRREVLWCSPACVGAQQLSLF